MLVVLGAKRYCFAYLLILLLASIGDVRATENVNTVDGPVYVAIYQWMIFSETYPGSMDGSVIVGVVGQGVPPYDVFLDGNYFNTQSGQYLLVDGLSAGSHTVQITDAIGQVSNLLTVTIGILYPNLRAVNLKLEPIIYSSYNEQDTIQNYDTDVHGWLSFDMLPGSTRQYLNVRFIHLYEGTTHWLVRNVPLPPSTETKRMWYRVNITELGEDYAFLDYQWKTSNYDVACPPNPNCSFCCGNSMEILTRHQVIGNGSDDVAPQVGDQIPPIPMPLPSTPGNISSHFRPNVPNIDLDCETFYPEGDARSTDMNACAAAAVANGLQWLVGQHPEIDDTTSLRTKLDSLKSYMHLARADLNGVRFDSAVIGQLTLIDDLQIPVRVSYQTVLDSGNTGAPLESADTTYGHVAENEGGVGLYPAFAWYRTEMLAGAAVELLVGWYSEPNGSGERTRLGGHWLVSNGYFNSDSLLGVWLQNDSDQCETGGLCREYYVWDTLVGNIPFLPGLTDAEGNIGIVEAVVSARYDTTVTFGDCATVVTSTEDSGAGSLRAVLECASAGDTIILDANLAGDTLILTSGPIVINKNITIHADPNLNIYVKGESVARVFEVLSGSTVLISGLRVICGTSDAAACLQNAGTVTLRDAMLFDHNGEPDTETQIINTGTLIIEGGVELRWE